MATRTVFTSASDSVPGGAFVDNVAGHINTLLNAICLVPTAISNSGNDYTITIDPPLTGDVVNNMGFWITPNAANTGAARIRIGTGNPYYKWTKANGGDFVSGEISTSVTYGVIFTQGEFRSVTVPAFESGAVFDLQTFTASGSWTKPLGISANALVLVELWGAGGGGGRRSGGGGGAYVYKWFRASQLGVTESVTIGSGGAGGASGSVGGQSTFGSSLVTAFGGGGGGTSGSGGRLGGGGGGGGSRSAGGNASGATAGVGGGGGGGGVNGGAGAVGGGSGGLGNYGGGGGASGVDGSGSVGGFGGPALYGGGGGGGAALGTGTSTGGNGGDSTYGGGGGAGQADPGEVSGTAGASLFGGAGGAVGAAGNAPAGGGGGGTDAASGFAGARGECRVHTIA